MRKWVVAILFFLFSTAAAHGQAACLPQFYNDFEGGTNGASTTPTNLLSTAHGVGGAWTVTGTITYQTAASHPLQDPTGELCGDSTIYPGGVGTLGLAETGTGASVRNSAQFVWTGNVTNTASVSFWFCSDLSATDSTAIDIALVSTNGPDFANITFGGNGAARFFDLETTSGNNPSLPYSPGTGCGPSGTGWILLQLLYTSNSSTGAGLNEYNSNGILIGSLTGVTIANTPTGVVIGHLGSQTLTSGKHDYWDSLQGNFVGTFPIAHSCIASSNSETDVTTAYNSCVTGGWLDIPSGSAATWSSLFSVSATGSLTIKGNSAVAVTGTPGQSGYSFAWTDNTNITLATCPAIAITNNGSGIFTTWENTSFTQTAASSGEGGCVQFAGTHGVVGGLFLRNHVTMMPGNLFLFAYNGFGAVIANEFDDTGSGGGGPHAFGGNFPSAGYLDWQDTTNPGTNQSWVVEQNIYSILGSTDGLVDAYYGAKFTFRFNNAEFQNSCASGAGWNHGTDSGGFRSTILMEIYGNYLNNQTPGNCAIGNSRGGATIYFGNTHVGSHPWTAFDQQYYRCFGQASSSGWGLICNTAGSSPFAAMHLNWVPVSATITNSNAQIVTLNASDWQASHTYTCSTSAPCIIGPTSNNSGGFNFVSLANCVSGSSRPSPFIQTFPPTTTTTDNTCAWINVGGTLNASPNPGVSLGFLPVAPDTTGTTSADTYAMDGLGTSSGYPGRDMIGRVNNQVNFSSTEWNNGGAQAPAPVFVTDLATSTYIVQNREFYDAQSTGCTGTQTTGVCRGLLASRAASCTAGVWYVATDQGPTWNTSGNGFGNDIASQCGSGGWPGSATYVPYTYPDPLQAGVPTPVTPTAPTNLPLTFNIVVPVVIPPVKVTPPTIPATISQGTSYSFAIGATGCGAAGKSACGCSMSAIKGWTVSFTATSTGCTMAMLIANGTYTTSQAVNVSVTIE